MSSSRATILILTILFGGELIFAAECDECCCDEVLSCDGYEVLSSDSIWTQSQLTGDWLGVRDMLAESGIVVQSSLTQFYQGVTSGGNDQTFEYGNKFDLYINADTGKLGLWEGGILQVHAADWQFGENINGEAVTLAPSNANLLTPENQPSFALTNLLYTHMLDDEYSVIFGRYNALDFWMALYPDYGRGVDGFMNISILFPLNAVPAIPLISNVAGIQKVGPDGYEAGFYVYETQNSPTTVGLDFPNGVTLAGLVRENTRFGGLQGTHTLGGIYATGEFTSFDTSGWVIIPGGGVIPARQTGTWSVVYIAEQRLWEDHCNAKRYVKAFGQVGYSDPNTSAFSVTGAVGIEAFGLLDSRPGDRAGIAYFYTGLNDDFKDLFALGANPLEDPHGGEVYYNAEVTPWCHITADLQVINPAAESNDTAIVCGLRAKIDL
ncbi:carbohydrate porin [Calycomorphotria hydatis]|uniref:Porin B n=1 Tax=Calycomorphotria hydatis TaxID=2528027 RepID=A0A517T442_9PLAN|nr:carbohydrate porin [Calycomorphotria hydatis]QDT63144.1 Porin B precursor [Calycomorphotria hydatis]